MAAPSGGRLWPATGAPSAAAARGSVGLACFLHQLRPLLLGAVNESRPPLAQLSRSLLGRAPDQQEIISGPQPQVFEQAKRGLAGAALETRLQRPDLSH